MCERMLLSLFSYPAAINIFAVPRAKLLILCVLISTFMLPETSMAVTPDTLPDSLPNALPNSLVSPAPEASTANTPEYVVIRPSEQVTYSSETAASIDTLTIHEGSKFNKGDVLLKMDCRLQQAELDKVTAQSELATTAEQSAIKLKSYGSISGLEMAKAHSEAETAHADVEKLSAVVDKCIIKAPFNGSVADLMVHPLETVKPGDPLFKIISSENLEFEIAIPSAWLKWLKIGSAFYVHLNETDKTVKVIVERIDPEIESVSQTIKITGVVQTPDPSLLPGMSGQAIFPDNPDRPHTETRT
jgi:membrane fusion protein (multidrug efflux system)